MKIQKNYQQRNYINKKLCKHQKKINQQNKVKKQSNKISMHRKKKYNKKKLAQGRPEWFVQDTFCAPWYLSA